LHERRRAEIHGDTGRIELDAFRTSLRVISGRTLRAKSSVELIEISVPVTDRQSRALVENIDLLRRAFRAAHHERPFSVDAVVVLPDHLHILMMVPPADANFPARWKRFKSLFTRLMVERGDAGLRNRGGEYALWQRRYWEHTIRDEPDLMQHIDYIHFNPVKHKLVSRVDEWPHSSFHRQVRQGVLPRDWGGSAATDPRFGERMC
jgi:putative transposase